VTAPGGIEQTIGIDVKVTVFKNQTHELDITILAGDTKDSAPWYGEMIQGACSAYDKLYNLWADLVVVQVGCQDHGMSIGLARCLEIRAGTEKHRHYVDVSCCTRNFEWRAIGQASFVVYKIFSGIPCPDENGASFLRVRVIYFFSQSAAVLKP